MRLQAEQQVEDTDDESTHPPTSTLPKPPAAAAESMGDEYQRIAAQKANGEQRLQVGSKGRGKGEMGGWVGGVRSVYQCL